MTAALTIAALGIFAFGLLLLCFGLAAAGDAA